MHPGETLAYRASAETVAAWRTDLAAGAGLRSLRAYLELSLVCQYIVEDRNVTISGSRAAVSRRTAHRVSSRRVRSVAGTALSPAVARPSRNSLTSIFALGRYALDIPQAARSGGGASAVHRGPRGLSRVARHRRQPRRAASRSRGMDGRARSVRCHADAGSDAPRRAARSDGDAVAHRVATTTRSRRPRTFSSSAAGSPARRTTGGRGTNITSRASTRRASTPIARRG